MKKPERIGKYQILDEIGQGGMGIVYKALHTGLDRLVAIKILPFSLAQQDPEFRERFLREARIMAGLNHLGVVRVIDTDTWEDSPYLVMDYIDGWTIRQVVSGGGKGLAKPPFELTIGWAAGIVAQVASALAYTHRQGVIHRDIKPSNVLVDRNGRAHITDFGIAKSLRVASTFTQTGVSLGTPTYMAPEQFAEDGRHPVDQRVDIYSLGCVFYEMVTGRVPFDGETPLGIAYKHVNVSCPPPRQANPSLSRALESVLLKMLSKRREDRYATCEQLLDDMKRIPESEEPLPTTAGPRPLGAEAKSEPATPTRVATKSLGPIRTRIAVDKRVQRIAAPPTDVAVSRGHDLSSQVATVSPPCTSESQQGTVSRNNWGANIAVVVAGILLVAGTWWALSLGTTRKVQPPLVEAPIRNVNVVLRSSPAGATVSFDGSVIGAKTPMVASVTTTTHVVRFVLKGYEPWEDEISAAEMEAYHGVIEATLKPLPVTVRVSSDQPGTVVVVDKEAISQSVPASLSLSSGESHQLAFSKAGFKTTTRQVTLGPGESTSVAVTMQKDTTAQTGTGARGALTLSSAPPGAMVYVDGILWKALTPCTIADLVPGRTYAVSVEKSGYQPLEKRVTVGSGRQSALFSLKTESESGSATLLITSWPSGALVFLNGELLGTTPYAGPSTVLGPVFVSLEKTGYVTETRAAILATGRQLTLDITLVPVP